MSFFTRDHDHTNSDQGGQITDAALSEPVVVTKGGTGFGEAGAGYAVLCAGTATSNPFQTVNNLGSIGQVLTSAGSGALPTWSSLKSFGGVDDIVSLGTEKVTNGAFAADTDWTKGTGWAIAGGVATKTAGVASDLEQNVSAVNGETYVITVNTKTTTGGGSFSIELGGVATAAVGVLGEGVFVPFSAVITATGTGNLKVKADSVWAGQIDDISVKKVLSYAPAAIELTGASTPQVELRSGKDGNTSLFIGLGAGRTSLSTVDSVGIGANAMRDIIGGTGNVAVGSGAMSDGGSPQLCTAIGYTALQNGAKVFKCTAVGAGALIANTTGGYNVAIGSDALKAATSGYGNTAVGHNCLGSVTTAAYITAVGYGALDALTTGTGCTAVGVNALSAATGANNTALGSSAGLLVSSGGDNTALGYCALDALTTNSGCTAVGSDALTAATGGHNTALGYNAGGGIVAGVYNVVVGYQAAGQGNVSYLTAVGYQAGNVVTGANNTFVGHNSGLLVTSGTDNVSVGYAALDALTTNSYCTAVGSSALTACTGTSNTAVGYLAGAAVSSGSYNVAIGTCALDAVTTERFNVAVGHNALTNCTGNETSTAVGYKAGEGVTTGVGNTALGGLTLVATNASDGSTAVGLQALNACTGAYNTSVGYLSGLLISSGTNNVAIGYAALDALTTNTHCVAVGSLALSACTAGYTTAVGAKALELCTSGASNTALGYAALNAITTNGSCTAVGSSALSNCTGSNNVAVGSLAGSSVVAGTYNTLVGTEAAQHSNVSYLTALGYQAGHSTSGNENTFVGYSAGASVTSGTSNVVVGSQAFWNGGTGSGNVIIGQLAVNSSGALTSTTAVGMQTMRYASVGADTCVAVGGYTGGGATRVSGNITAVANNGSGFARFTTSAPTALLSTETVRIAGTTDYNGDFVATVISSTQFDTTQSFVSTQTGTFETRTTGANSVSIGYYAGAKLTTGTNNILVGFQAGYNIGTASGNTAIGHATLTSCTSGPDNVVIGNTAGQNITTSGYNTIVGSNAAHTSTMSNLTAVGYQAGHVVSGSDNAFFGCNAGLYVSSGTYNVIMGAASGYGISIGAGNIGIGNLVLTGGNADYSTAVGHRSMRFALSGSNNNVSLGAYALGGDLRVTGTIASVANNGSGFARFTTGTTHGLTSGETVAIAGTTNYNGIVVVTVIADNTFDTTQSYVSSQTGTFETRTLVTSTVAIGANAGSKLTSGTGNTLVGYYAGAVLGAGANNSALGYGSLAACVSGTSNTAVGANALDAVTTGSYCTAIGAGALGVATGNNNTAVGYNSGGITSGTRNVAIGDNTLGMNCSNSVAVGSFALSGAVGNENIALGISSGRVVSTSARSVAAGHNTLGGGYRQNDFSSVANNGSGKARFNVGSVHNYVAGDTIRIISSVYYNGDVAVTNVSDTTHFDTAQTFTNTDTGVSYSLTTGSDNVCLGAYSQKWISSANKNVSVGAYAAASLYIGANNAALGHQALASCTTGSSNVALGYMALYTGVTSSANVAIGNSALSSATIDGNVAVGDSSGLLTTTGTGDVFVGRFAGYSVTTGSEHTFIGYMSGGGTTRASGSITSVANNGSGLARFTTSTTHGIVTGETVRIAGTTNYNGDVVATSIDGTSFDTTQSYVSSQAGTFQTITTGTANTSTGFHALRVISSGYDNVAVGRSAMTSAGTASRNVAIGRGTLNYNIIGTFNTAVGHNAGVGVLADYNTLIGGYAGDSITSGTYNICIGHGSDCSATLVNSMAIGANSSVTASNSACIGGTGGSAVNVGIGVTAPTARLHLPAGTATAGTAPAKFTTGTLLSAVADGAVEYDGTHFYVSIGSTRYQVDQQGGGAPTTATFWTATAEAGLSAEVNLGALTTGLLKHTVAAGVSTPATATADVDYVTPTGSVILTNKTLTTPTIGDLTNAGHNHTNAAGGAQLTDAALSAAVGVAKGGTGKTSVTAYAVLCGGTTTTGVFQSLASNGTAGQVMISGGATAIPTWSSAPTISDFTSSGHNHTNAAGGAQLTDAALSAAVGVTKGGTGLTTATTAYALVCSGTTATGAFQVITSAGTAGQLLASGGAAAVPSWTSAPSFTNFTNANHNHTTAALGGTLTDAALSAAVGVAKGGTGLTTATTAFGVVCAGTTATGAFQVLNSLGTSGQILTSGVTGLPTWAAPTTTPTITSFVNAAHNHTVTAGSGGQLTDAALSSQVTVAKGGTGATSIAAYSVVCGGTTTAGPLQVVASNGTAGQVMVSGGATGLPTWTTSPTIDATNFSSVVPVTKGGTGLATGTTAYSLVCSGTVAAGAFQVLSSAGTAGQLLASGGASAVPAWTSAPAFTNFTNANHNHTTAALGGQITDAALSAAVGPTKGGTGLTATAAWSVVCGGTAANGTLQQVASVGTAGQVLISNAAGLPTWSTSPTIGMTNANHNHTSAAQGGQITDAALSAAVTVAKGGTGLTTATTAYAVICAGTTATGNFQPTASAGTAGQILTSNGSAALPSWQDAPSSGWTVQNKAFATTGYTAAVGEHVRWDASGGACTCNLPTAAGNSGKTISVKKVDSSVNTVTVDASSTQTIDGQLTCLLNVQYEAVTLISDGSNWDIL